MKYSKLKWEPENFRDKKTMLDKYVTFKQTLEQIKTIITKKFGVGLLLATDDRIITNDSERGRGVW